MNCMKKSDGPPVPRETSDLEFPDWSGMDDRSSRVTPEAAFWLCEQYPVWFPEWVEKCRRNRPEKCTVEFIL
jgi:hypothetical protein